MFILKVILTKKIILPAISERFIYKILLSAWQFNTDSLQLCAKDLWNFRSSFLLCALAELQLEDNSMPFLLKNYVQNSMASN